MLRVNSYFVIFYCDYFEVFRFVSVFAKGPAMNFKHLHYFWVTAKAGGVCLLYTSDAADE